MKKNGFKVFLVTLIFSTVLFGVGCSSIKSLSKTAATSSSKEKAVIIKSKDSKESITVPDSWKEDNTLNDIALLQVSKRTQEKYVMVIGEGLDSFSKDMKLSDYTKLVKDSMLKAVANSTATDTTDITVGENKCQYYELSGEVQKIKATYIVRTVATKNKFYQIIAWTLTPKFDANKAEIKEVMDSFKVIP